MLIGGIIEVEDRLHKPGGEVVLFEGRSKGFSRYTIKCFIKVYIEVIVVWLWVGG